MIYTLTLWQIWIQVTQLYTQENPTISTYETSYIPDTPMTLPEMKQQVFISMRVDGKFVKELDP